MKAIALVVVVATLAGCAIVPIGPLLLPPLIIGVHAHGDGYRGGYDRGGYERGYYH